MAGRGRRRRDPRRPLAMWREPDWIGRERVEAQVAILATEGCSWSRGSGCTVCGYTNDCPESVSEADLDMQIEKVLDSLEGADALKVFTSGSFLDCKEVPASIQLALARGAGERVRRLTIESRPEHVSGEGVRAIAEHVMLEVALGLESASDLVLEKCVNKGSTVAQYVEAAGIIRDGGAEVKTYLLLKPPFLTEREAVEDALESVRLAAGHSTCISLNPVNVQRGTLVERMWRRRQYRTPWLWSVVEVLRNAERGGARLVSQPTAGGKERGAHNCGRCDESLLLAIEEFNESQDTRAFEGLSCSCKERWMDAMELDGLYQNSLRIE